MEHQTWIDCCLNTLYWVICLACSLTLITYTIMIGPALIFVFFMLICG